MRSIIFIIFLLPFIGLSQNDTIIEKKVLNIGVKNTPPFIINTGDKYTGISIDLWESIASKKGYDFVYSDYTQKIEDSNIDVMINDVINQKIDICINPLTVNKSRLEKFDFGQPFYISSLAVAVKTDDSTFLSNFFSEGLLKVIIIILIVVLFFGFLLWLAEKKHYPDNKGFGGFINGWLKSTSLILSSKKSKSIKSGTGNFISLIGALIIIFIICGYAAASFFQLNTDKNAEKASDIQTLKELSVGTITATAPQKYLKEQNISTENYTSISELIEALLNGEIEAIVYDEPILKYEIHEQEKDDYIHILPYQFNKQYYSFSAATNNTIIDEVNPLIFEIFESSEWDSILTNYNLSR
jgi:polar amino acid transport system substrate-binding protein